MTRAMLNRIRALEDRRVEVAVPVLVFVPTHPEGTSEAMAEQSAWQALHPHGIVCQVIDQRRIDR